VDVIAVRCEREIARSPWRRILESCEDPTAAFGPDVNRDLHPAERYYLLTVDSQTIGLGWVRRFTSGGHILSYGFGLFADARGHRIANQASRALLMMIFDDFPAASTILAMAYSSNPHKRWQAAKEGRRRVARYVGEILDAAPKGVSLHISQITRAAAMAELEAVHET
jgi:hypothetical protein